MWRFAGQHSEHVQTPRHAGMQTTPQSQLDLFGLQDINRAKCFNVAVSAMCHGFPMQNLVNNLQRQDCYCALIHPRFSLWAHELANQMTIELFRSPCSQSQRSSHNIKEEGKGWGCARSSSPVIQAHSYWYEFQVMPQAIMNAAGH